MEAFAVNELIGRIGAEDRKLVSTLATEHAAMVAALSAAKAEVERLTTALRQEFATGAEYQRLRAIAEAQTKAFAHAADTEKAEAKHWRADRDRLAAEVERLTKERDAVMREADRLRHGVGIEGDFVCPNELENTRLAARVCELELTGEEREALAMLRSTIEIEGRYGSKANRALALLDRLVKGGR